MAPADVAVVGAGAVGLAIARAYAEDGARVVLLERNSGPGREQSTHNSGVVHSGVFARPGTLRAALNVEGNRRMFEEAAWLGVEAEQCGTLVVARAPADLPQLEAFRRQGEANRVPGLRRIPSSEASDVEPNLRPFAGALWTPTGGRVDPAGLVRALDGEAVRLGVDRRFDFEVVDANRGPELCELASEHGGVVEARFVVNAAGLGAGRVAARLGADAPRIYPCLGEYARVVGTRAGWVRTMVYGIPAAGYPGLGVHLTRTTRGELLIGPTATYLEQASAPPLPLTTLAEFADHASEYLPGLTARDLVPAPSGVRAKLVPPGSSEAFDDFRIFEDPRAPGAVHLLGIESPGLTASFAIAEYVRGRWPVRRG